MLRWKGIIFIVVFTGIFIVLSFLLTDAWLESQLEDAATSINGAKVEFDNLDLSLLEQKINWQHLRVTDPKSTMKNMIESGFCEFEFEFWPLLSKKIIIDNIQIDSLRTNTDRETDGSIEEDALAEQIVESNFVTEAADRLNEKVESIPTLQLAGQIKSTNVDSIMKIMNITSMKKIESLQKDLNVKYNELQQLLTKLEYEKDLKEIETEIKSFNVKKIKTIEDFRAAVNSINDVKSKISTISKEVSNTKNKVEKDLSGIRTNIAKVDDWVEADYKSALSIAKLPEISTQNIGEILFGKKVIDQVLQYLGYVGKAREYSSKFQSDSTEKKDPPRLKGQDIYFPNKYGRPDYWVKNIELSGETQDNIILSGKIKNIVSDQTQIDTTTFIEIRGSSDAGASLNLTGNLNYLEDEPKENFYLQYAGFSLANTSLSDSKLLPNKVNKGNGKVESSFNLSGDKIDGKVIFTGQNLEFDFSDKLKSTNKIDELILSIMKSISTIDLVAKIKGEGGNLNFSLNSNLDDVLASRIKAQLGKEFESAKQKIRSEIDKKVNKYRSQLTALISEKESLLKNDIAKYEKMIKDKTALADKKKKEIESEIDNQKNKQLKKVKDIFKF